MSAENLHSTETKDVSEKPVTTLDLFNLTKPQHRDLGQRWRLIKDTLHNYGVMVHSYTRFTGELRESYGHLQEVEVELEEQRDLVRSSIASYLGYQKLTEELSVKGISKEDIFKTFQLCLAFNTRITQNTNDTITPARSHGFLIKTPHALPSISHYFQDKNLISKEEASPPEWFKDDKKKWIIFLATHGNFVIYLNPDLVNKCRSTPPLITREAIREGRFFITKVEGYPDWMDEDRQKVPEQQEVEEEYLDDQAELERISKQSAHIEKQQQALSTWIDEKEAKVGAHINRSVSGFTQITDFYSTLLVAARVKDFRSLTYSLWGLPLQPNGQQEIKEREEQDAAKMIKSISTASEVYASPPMLALYFEQVLQKAGVMESGQDAVNEKFCHFWQQLVEEIVLSPDKIDPVTRVYKETDKPFYKAVVYGLKPYLLLLSDKEKTDLEAYITTCQAEAKMQGEKVKAEDIIFWAAELTSQAIARRVQGEKSPKEIPLVKDQVNFTHRFLTNNLQWANDRLVEKLKIGWLLGSPQTESVLSEAVPITISQPEVVCQTEELTTSAKEVSKSPLSDWDLKYTLNRSSTGRLERVDGATLREIVNSLDELFNKHGVACSIKSSSVVSALEWLSCSVPEKIDFLRMSKEVNGEVFRKVKRGKMRIFYTIDRISKSLTFFVEMKKSLYYRFGKN